MAVRKSDDETVLSAAHSKAMHAWVARDYHLAAMEYESAMPRGIKFFETAALHAARMLHGLAGVYVRMERFAEAEALYQRCLAIMEAAFGENHLGTAATLNELATLYRTLGKHDQAKPLFVRSLQIKEARLGEQHPDAVEIRCKLAELHELMA